MKKTKVVAQILFLVLVCVAISYFASRKIDYKRVLSVKPGDKAGNYQLVIKVGSVDDPEYPTFKWRGKHPVKRGDTFVLGTDTTSIFSTWYRFDFPSDTILARGKNLQMYEGTVVEIRYYDIDSRKRNISFH